MTRVDWINELESILLQDMPANQVKENVDYYNDYINNEIKIKSEQQVLSELGEPRLIGHTLIDAYNVKMEQNQSGRTSGYAQKRSSYVGDDYNQESDEYYNQDPNRIYFSTGKIKWYHKALFFAILAVIIAVIYVIGAAILKILFRFGLPIILVLIVVKIFRDRR